MGFSTHLGLGPITFETNDLPYWSGISEPRSWLQPTSFGDIRVTVNKVDGDILVSRKICVHRRKLYSNKTGKPVMPFNSNGSVGMENPNNVDGLVSIATKLTKEPIDRMILQLWWELGPNLAQYFFVQTIFKENNTNED